MKNKSLLEKFGKWALITGASAGIGEAFARELASKGFNLVLAARREKNLEKLGNDLQLQYAIDIRVLTVDLTKADAVDLIISKTQELDIGLLISNAGAARPDRVTNRSLSDIQEIIQLNALSQLQLTHHFSRQMAEKRHGGIILVGAMGAVQGIPYMAIESGTKAMIESFGKALHEELLEFDVSLTVLVTSPTDTPALDYLGFTNGEMPAKPVSTKKCVDETLDALIRNQSSIIPGQLYRVMNTLVPEKISRKMMGNLIKKNNQIA